MEDVLSSFNYYKLWWNSICVWPANGHLWCHRIWIFIILCQRGWLIVYTTDVVKYRTTFYSLKLAINVRTLKLKKKNFFCRHEWNTYFWTNWILFNSYSFVLSKYNVFVKFIGKRIYLHTFQIFVMKFRNKIDFFSSYKATGFEDIQCVCASFEELPNELLLIQLYFNCWENFQTIHRYGISWTGPSFKK